MIIALLCFYIAYRIYFWFPVNKPKIKLHANRLSVFYGAPGSGKSTLACYYAQRALKAGYDVYSNVPILGCKILKREDIGKVKITDGLVIIDEVGVEYNNRDFKSNFNKSSGGADALEWFKKHRHEGCEVMVFSQGFDDMDSKIRGLGTDYYMVRKSLIPYLVTYKRIRKKPEIDVQTRQPIDAYDYVPFSSKRIAMPPLWAYFDSFDRMELPSKKWSYYGGEVSAPKQSAETDSVVSIALQARELGTLAQRV